VPAVVNVCWNVEPLARSGLAALPSSRVTVWVVESLFVQVTVVPERTLRVAGEKLKFAIATDPPGAAATGAAGVPAEYEPEQAPTTRATAMSRPKT